MAKNVKLEESDDLEASDDILQFNNFCVLMELNIFSTVILASHSFLQFVAFWCRSAFIVASDWFVLPIKDAVFSLFSLSRLRP